LLEVAAAVIKRKSDGYIFLIHNESLPNSDNHWKFPWGKIRNEETAQKCLVRVIQEQFGISPEIGELYTEKGFERNGEKIKITAFWVTNIEESLNSKQGIWLPPEQLFSMEWDFINGAIVQVLEDHYIDNTRDFYENSSGGYFNETVNNSMESSLEKFIQFMPEKGKIMDLGCGSGRDSKYLMDKGFQVVALDYSPSIVKKASEYLEQDVLEKRIEDIDYQCEFDGIWACASLLHISERILKTVLPKIIRALRTGGVLYTSFKEGNGISIDEKGRYFNNQTVGSFTKLLKSILNTEIIEVWRDESILRDRKQAWISALIRKVEKNEK